MLCPCSQVVFSNTKIYVARVTDAATEISDAFLGPFFGELKSKRFMDWVFGRDRLSGMSENPFKNSETIITAGSLYRVPRG
jgi:hypothetical protein